jgi:Cu(I)/Ag(I) efflux system protein CusF
VKESEVSIRALVFMTAVVLVAVAPADAQTGLIDGQVTKIDEAAGKITIRHRPIKKLGMDHGMTMVFHAGEAAMLKSVRPGDKVKFDAERLDGRFTVTKIQKAK